MAPVLALAVLIVGSLFAGRGGIGCCREVFQTFWGADKIIDRGRAGHAGGEVWFSRASRIDDVRELMTHIATTNYQFCAGLKDSEPPALPNTTDKDAIVKFLNDSFAYCATVIPSLTEEQIGKPHNSPDGRLPGREVLLAM